MTYLLQWFVHTDTGPVRTVNEDYVQIYPDADVLSQQPDFMPPEGRLCVVADGLGGHRGGREASMFAARRIGYHYYNQQGNNPEHLLCSALLKTNNEIVQRGQEDFYLRGMGTTVVLVVAQDTCAWVLNVGDSRAYLWRHGQLQLLSRDDRWVTDQVGQTLTAEQAQTHTQRHLLSQYLGSPHEIKPHVQQVHLQPEDKILLCTDGLYDVVDDATIASVLTADPQKAVPRLIHLAIQNGTQDNVTVAVGYYGSLRPWTMIYIQKLLKKRLHILLLVIVVLILVLLLFVQG